MKDGFVVTCQKCGKITLFFQNDLSVDRSNNIISIHNVDYNGQIGIECDCGNKVEDKI